MATLTNSKQLRAPFPYFGGKSSVAALVWSRLGWDVPNYIEPFFGSGAVLLARPNWTPGVRWVETVNDADGMVANFWRAVKHAPEEVAKWADWPVNENDLHARHVWLRGQRESLRARLEGDPEWYDARIAGWWVWGISIWIGGAWCSGELGGPWAVRDGMLVKDSNARQQGVQRSLPHIGRRGEGITVRDVYTTFEVLCARLRHVRVACGDFVRVLGRSTCSCGVPVAVFLDPPYPFAFRRDTVYALDSDTASARAREWAIAHGDDPAYRIALCGYEGVLEMPANWECVAWSARPGYANRAKNHVNENRHRERIWFSPHCLKPNGGLLDDV